MPFMGNMDIRFLPVAETGPCGTWQSIIHSYIKVLKGVGLVNLSPQDTNKVSSEKYFLLQFICVGFPLPDCIHPSIHLLLIPFQGLRALLCLLFLSVC